MVTRSGFSRSISTWSCAKAVLQSLSNDCLLFKVLSTLRVGGGPCRGPRLLCERWIEADYSLDMVEGYFLQDVNPCKHSTNLDSTG